MKTTRLSFVIPCYCSERTIEHVINEIISVVSQRCGYDYEIICVNDASPDNVLAVLKNISENNTCIKVINLAKNFGKHSAVMAGYSFVTGEYVVGLDDDGQCPMNRLWDLVDPIVDNKADMTMADYPRKKQSAFKNFGSYINSLMSMALINKPKNLHFSNFNVKKRFIIDEILKYQNPYPYLEGLILRTTNNILPIPMEERDRYAGKGNFTFFKSLALWINCFTAFSVKPLRMATFIGLFCSIMGFIAGVFVIIRKLIKPQIAMGYSSTMALLLFIGGMLMLMLGMIGEYIGRIYISINNSPQYVIRNTINTNEEKKFENC